LNDVEGRRKKEEGRRKKEGGIYVELDPNSKRKPCGRSGY
jgi:hypothetical protein